MNKISLSDWVRRWPFVVLVALSGVFALMLLFSRKAPIIHDITPSMASPGQVVLITGDYFGRNSREGTLNVAGQIPPPSLIKSWKDKQIELIVPPDAPSGLLTVSNSQGTSDGVLFTNTQKIPTVLQDPRASGAPFASAVLPANPVSGQIVTIVGTGFGDFTSGSRIELKDAVVASVPASIARSWTDRSVSFELPSGFGPETSLRIVTSRGTSEPFALLSRTPIRFGKSTTYVLGFQVDTEIKQGSGRLTLWAPVPQSIWSTPWAIKSSSTSALRITDTCAIFQWENSSAGVKTLRFEIEVTVAERVWKGLDSPPAASEFEGATELFRLPIATHTPKQKSLLAQWGVESSDPMVKARRIFSNVTQSYAPATLKDRVPWLENQGPPATFWDQKTFDPYEFSVAFAALCRTSGLPSRVVSGFLAEASAVVERHFWAEVYVPGWGWISADPSLAAGGKLPGGLSVEKPSEYYFGNLDARHIPWTAIEVETRKREVDSKLVQQAHPFAFQGTLAEYSGNLEISPPIWHDVAILSVHEGGP